VTGSGFVALASTLTVIHDIPLAGLALLIGIDRFMSEARALTSLASNAVATVVIALGEDACDRDKLMRALASGKAEPLALPEAAEWTASDARPHA